MVTGDVFGPPLAAFIRGDLDLKPEVPPTANLGRLLCSLDSELLAAIALMPLLDGWARGWNWEKQSTGTVFLEVGRELEAHLDTELTERERGLAGAWLVDCATTMSYFDYDAAGFPIVAPDWEDRVSECREVLLRRHPIHLAHEKEPPPWTTWRQRFPGRMPATFVRDWRPETRQAIEQAFKNPNWEHPRALNALQRMPLELDPMIVDLVGRFAIKIEDAKGKLKWKLVNGEGDQELWVDRWTNFYNLVQADLDEAHYWLGRPFWLTYNTDKRGRIFSLQHLHFGREDHVRAMFRFHKGEKLGPDGLYWLAVHVANCEGTADKFTWNERVAWVEANYPRIESIGTARDPGAVFEDWRDADKPFAFVAACREYVAAKADPENFTTHLPVSFDHTCSGIQHLAMIMRDEKAGALVNVLDADRPQDIYLAVARQLKDAIDAAKGEFADWWKAVFAQLSERDRRKLLKRPVMTYAYAAEKNSRQQQIAEEYYKLRRKNRFKNKVPEGAFGYLANEAEKVIEELLPAPAKFMRWMKEFARYHAERGDVLTWTNPTGFPVRNAYHVPQEPRRVSLQRGGVRIRFNLADGATKEISMEKTLRSAAANFVHSMDASHLVRVVNAAADPVEGIKDILVVHDSFACHAPRAVRLNQIIRRELATMYQAGTASTKSLISDVVRHYDPISNLCGANRIKQMPAPPNLIPPPLGDLDPMDVQSAEWACI